MVTDPPPRDPQERRAFDESDRRLSLPLPDAALTQSLAAAVAEALATGLAPPVRKAGLALLMHLAQHYAVDPPALSVLGLRPHKVLEGHGSYELFGDYTFETQKIRVWMRTAVLGKITSFRGLLNTLVHEFLHHLDVKHFGCADTPHTRGFYTRIDALYHHCLGTPAGQRMPLIWRKRGVVWAADWPAMRAALRR
ncbi:MAG: hypothetical protein SF187_15795 [Deltaproteobacteria bacterium]|nr:hypothetical protein [Deltaproteobacteria bacterium]